MRDQEFIRGNVPMTKSEARAVSLSKLELKEDSVLYDVGAGTGSVSVEAARQLPKGHVYSIEKNGEAASLIGQNMARFAADNITIVQGLAPEALEGLACPTHAFVGGSAGRMEELLSALLSLNPHIRIVINLVALETLSQVVEWLEKEGREAEVVTLWVAKARKLKDYHLMQGQNPVTIVSFGGKP